jgi:hypothetical protein
MEVVRGGCGGGPIGDESVVGEPVANGAVSVDNGGYGGIFMGRAGCNGLQGMGKIVRC